MRGLLSMAAQLHSQLHNEGAHQRLPAAQHPHAAPAAPLLAVAPPVSLAFTSRCTLVGSSLQLPWGQICAREESSVAGRITGERIGVHRILGHGSSLQQAAALASS